MSSERRKLLLADDSPTIQKVVSLTFEDEGLEVVTVGDGRKALLALEADEPPDILLADVLMPGPNGYELCERVKQDRRLKHVPVVLLVGTFEPFNEAEARRVGADTVLTKPFQSIRDMVSKVGSLLGGGSKQEEPALEPQPREESHEESAATSAGAASAPEQFAHAGGASAEHGETLYAEPDASFADLGADDELIEARPADSFGTASSGAAHESHGYETRESYATEARDSSAHDAQTREASQSPQHSLAEPQAPARVGESSFETNEREAFTMNGHAHAAHEEHHAPSFAGMNEPAVAGDEPQERVMAAQTSFKARAASASADDSLLDLGQTEQHAGVAVADEDDFILDLDDDMQGFASSVNEASTSSGNEANISSVNEASMLEGAVLDEPQPSMFNQSDAPSAFAEAAHGDPLPAYSEPSTSFHEDPSYSEAPSHSSEPASTFSPFEFSSPDVSAQDDTTTAEVVMQDEPRPFESYAEHLESHAGHSESHAAHYEVGEAPRGFVEPEVVPADEPVPAVVEGEYTDGSVEGDTAKAPVGHDAIQTAGRARESVTQSEPSTAGYVVGESRHGVEEPALGDELSQAAVDRIARRVVELMSDKAVREIAWEVVPELAELLIKQRLDEERQK